LKQALRLLTVFCLLALYGTAVLQYNALVAAPGAKGYPADRSYLTSVAFTLASHTAQTAGKVAGFKAPAASPFTFLAAGTALGGHVTGLLTQQGFARYQLYYEGLLIHTRKQDILFPFHYHW
jgi:hypothetical protein